MFSYASYHIPRIFSVPLGFVCGYPLSGGEQYGGSMFIKSAANDTLQGRAIQSINERWAINKNFKNWTGTETIGIPVCKKKYSPFDFRKRVEEDGRVYVEVFRMYGCSVHSHMREKIIKKYGVRKGWEPFGQWSMKKAQKIAKELTDRLNTSIESGDDQSLSSSSSDSDDNTNVLELRRLCHNGRCAWKLKHKYDDVYEEIQERGGAE